MSAEQELRERLVEYANFWGDRPGFAYRGPTDFLLRHGESFEPRPLPAAYDYGAPKACFANAIIIAELCGIAYVEGYALGPFGLPIHHAWNADEGGLVDVTWRAEEDGVRVAMPDAAYIGVRFSVDLADDATWNGDASVLDDYARGWPLLREEWKGEGAAAYETSPHLRALRSPDPRRAAIALLAEQENE